MAKALLDRDTLSRDEVAALIEGKTLPPKVEGNGGSKKDGDAESKEGAQDDGAQDDGAGTSEEQPAEEATSETPSTTKDGNGVAKVDGADDSGEQPVPAPEIDETVESSKGR